MTLNFGSVPDWIAALGTVVALLALVMSSINERKLRRADAARVLEEKAERERRSARRVTVYVHGVVEQFVQLEIHNGGDAPILELDAGVYLNGTRVPGQVVNSRELMIVPAGRSVIANVEMQPTSSVDRAVAGVVFVDGDYGIRWRRLHDSEPERVNG